MFNDLGKKYIGSVLRHVLSYASGVLGMYGVVLSQQQQTALHDALAPLILSILVQLFSHVWSLIQKKKETIKLETAKLEA